MIDDIKKLANKIANNTIININNNLEQQKNKVGKIKTIITLKNVKEEDDTLFKRNNSILNGMNEDINFIKLILNEVNKINKVVISDNKLFSYNSFYLGNGVLYINNEFNNYTNEQQLQIILNHIFHYLGGLFVMKYDDTKLSYNLLSLLLFYGKKPKSNLSNGFYNKYYKSRYKKFIVFSTNKYYKDMILNNINKLSFVKKMRNYNDKYLFCIITMKTKINAYLYELQIDENNNVEISKYNNNIKDISFVNTFLNY